MAETKKKQTTTNRKKKTEDVQPDIAEHILFAQEVVRVAAFWTISLLALRGVYDFFAGPQMSFLHHVVIIVTEPLVSLFSSSFYRPEDSVNVATFAALAFVSAGGVGLYTLLGSMHRIALITKHAPKQIHRRKKAAA